MNENLQRAWRLVGIQMPNADELIVKVTTGTQAPYPDPVGRDGSRVLAEPAVWLEACSAAFHFTACVVVRIWDDSAMLDEAGEAFEGETFRLYPASSLLTKLAHQRTVSALYHYRLFTDNGGTVIDVIARKAPHISLREFQSSGLFGKR